jgi:hypothetical protein
MHRLRANANPFGGVRSEGGRSTAGHDRPGAPGDWRYGLIEGTLRSHAAGKPTTICRYRGMRTASKRQSPRNLGQASLMSEVNAYHEAGHAFMAVYVGARVRSVTIEPEDDDGPARYADIQVEWPLRRFGARELREKSVLVALAGPVAEMLYTGEPYHPGFVAEWGADWKTAWQEAASLVPDERKRLGYLEQAAAELYRLLDQEQPWAAIAAIADHLLAHDSMEGDEVAEIVQFWLSYD